MKNSQINLAGKSKLFLALLMVWQTLRLLSIAAAGVGVVVALFTFASIPMALMGLGALALAPQVNSSRRRTVAIAWW